uniref:Uncharacterized protein n=1 Tax=Timema poppense TaxID=170557 RepID=A0A7R9H9J2_TIMPO|nr:unnamed protein product [Timema poppensis]
MALLYDVWLLSRSSGMSRRSERPWLVQSVYTKDEHYQMNMLLGFHVCLKVKGGALKPPPYERETTVLRKTQKSVQLKPRPWLERWERQNLQGVQPFKLPKRFFEKAKAVATPWEKFDLMKTYRSTIAEEEQSEIFSEVYSELHQLEFTRKKMKRKKMFVKPKKTA